MKEKKWCKENNETLNIFKENTEAIITVSAFVLSILEIIKRIIRYFYSPKVEQFYGIPEFYFYDSLQTETIRDIIFYLAMLMIILSPPIIKKYLKKSKLNFSESLIFSFVLACFVFYLSLVFYFSIIINQLQLKGYDFLPFLLSIVSGFVYFFVFRNDLSEYSNSDKQKIDKDKAKQKKKIKIAFVIVGTVSMIMAILLMYNSIQLFPENQKNYEIIEESNTECKVIVGYYKDLAILMNGKIKWSNEEKIRHLEIVRGEYVLNQLKIKNWYIIGLMRSLLKINSLLI